MGPNLLAFVEGCQFWFSDDKKPFLGAQHASFGRRVEGCTSIQDPPADGVGGPPPLDVPDVRAQDRLPLVPLVLERGVVVGPSCFKVGTAAAHIGLRLSRFCDIYLHRYV